MTSVSSSGFRRSRALPFAALLLVGARCRQPRFRAPPRLDATATALAMARAEELVLYDFFERLYEGRLARSKAA